uniref:Glutamate receptor interacting protein 1 n=1 Tax=Molossus molossus TaxID=27622 RepID=A0A7J8FYI5_MOLMO|nr:glutamate receptor interacting protein 1 [Molossus molossus]
MWRRTPLQPRSQANSPTCTRPPCPVWTVLWTRGMALASMPAMGIKALAFRPQDTAATPMTGGVPSREVACPRSPSLEARLTQMWG